MKLGETDLIERAFLFSVESSNCAEGFRILFLKNITWTVRERLRDYS